MLNLQNKTKNILFCGVFAAMLCVSAQIIVPVGVTPISLATLAVMLCGGVLGAKQGTLTVLLYLLLGCMGLPVFAGFQGGFSVLIGTNGGFLIGYIPLCMLTAKAYASNKNKYARFLILCCAHMSCYVLGTLWLCVLTKTQFWLLLCSMLITFGIGDIAKTVGAHFILQKLKQIRRF